MTFRRFTACIAPKSFFFKDPDNGRIFNGSSIQDVASKVRLYRSQNEMEDIPFLEAVIENFLCNDPSNVGGCEPLPRLKRGWMEVLRGSVAVLKSMLYDSFATQETADQRAEICLTCPLNTFYEDDKESKQGFDAWCDDLAEQVVGDRKSKYNNKLGICAGCNCGLRFKIYYNDVIKLTKKQEKVMSAASPSCWQVASSRAQKE